MNLTPNINDAALQLDIYDNGVLLTEEHRMDGELYDTADGTAAYRRWHRNGRISEEVHCRKGIRHGRCRAWNEDGDLIRDELWENGNLVG